MFNIYAELDISYVDWFQKTWLLLENSCVIQLLSKTILIKNVSEIPLDCSQDSQTPNWIFDHS